MITRTSTGVHDLDELLNGGLPVPSTLLILGDVGTGKSVLCQRFVYAQAKAGFRCTYFCIDQPPAEVRENMTTLGWDPVEFERRGLIRFVDIFIGDRRIFEDIVATIEKYIMKNDRFVIDSISSIAFTYGEKRAYDLVQKIHSWILKTKGVGIINAVRGMHSKRFETAIQHIVGNTIVLERCNERVYIWIAKTTKTSHKKGRFRLEINGNVIKIQYFLQTC